MAANNNPQPLPRAILVVRLLWLCFFSLFTVIVGNIVLMAVPQAREAVQNIKLTPDNVSLFVVAFLYWAFAAWFTSRLLLGRRLDADPLGAGNADKSFVQWVAAVLPRALGFAATVPLTIAMWQIEPALGVGLAFASVLFLLFVVLRRRVSWLQRLRDEETETRQTEAHRLQSYAYFTRIGPGGRLFVEALFLVSMWLLVALVSNAAALIALALWVVLFLLRMLWWQRALRGVPWGSTVIVLAAAGLAVLNLVWPTPTELARGFGAPALLLFALGSWTMVGSFVLTYVPRTLNLPSWAPWVPPLLLLVCAPFNDNHLVAQRDLAKGLTAEGDWRGQRSTLVAHFSEWLKEHRAGEPIYMVAVAGGASRAAYWAGSVLGRLEDEAELACRRFGGNMFMLSSISGGSLGAAAYVSELARGSCPPGAPCRQHRIEQFLKNDSLSPVIGMMLFPDLFQRFLPRLGPVSSRADRSLGLEVGWEEDWAALPDLDASQKNWWRAPIATLYAPTERVDPLPSLVLNTVRLDDGRRMLQSNLAFTLPSADDLLDPKIFDTHRLTLAGAVHNSARFPYVSPPGTVFETSRAADPAPGKYKGEDDKTATREVWGRLGDGGYYEASGTATLADVLEKLRDAGALRSGRQGGLPSGLWACRGGWESDGTCASKPDHIVAIFLDNSPTDYPQAFVRRLDGTGDLASDAGQIQQGMPLPDFLGPVFGGLGTRSELSQISQRRLSMLVGDQPDAFIELRMPRVLPDRTLLTPKEAELCGNRRAQPSMTWGLDDCARLRLSVAADPNAPRRTLAEQALFENLARLRTLFSASQGLTASCTRKPARPEPVR